MRRWPVLLAALLFLLSGCAPQARELDGMALVRVLGVDGGEEVTLTAVCGGKMCIRDRLSCPRPWPR